MNESEQEQAIADIRARHTVPDIDTGRGGPIAHPDCVALLKIVDSQAQKICEQAKKIERLKYKIKAADLRGANE